MSSLHCLLFRVPWHKKKQNNLICKSNILSKVSVVWEINEFVSKTILEMLRILSGLKEQRDSGSDFLEHFCLDSYFI